MNTAKIYEKWSFTEVMSSRNQNIKGSFKPKKKSEKLSISIKSISTFLAGCIATIVIGIALPNVFVLPNKVSKEPLNKSPCASSRHKFPLSFVRKS